MSNEIPQKFADWLLFMGCPPDKIPSTDKMEQMCRGECYLVWRSIMEKVQSKHVVQEKRLQVFIDDIRRLSSRNRLKEKEIKAPLELEVWQEHKELTEQLAQAQTSLRDSKQKLQELMGIVALKVTKRAAVMRRVEDYKRRSWLLERQAEELESLKENLIKMQDIANSFQHHGESTDVQVKVDKCVNLLTKQNSIESNPSANSVSTASSSDTSDCDLDEHLASLMNMPSSAVWSYVYERRAAIVRLLSEENSHLLPSEHKHQQRITAQSVLARSASLHCALVLNTIKNQKTMASLHQKLAEALNNYHVMMTEEGRELLLLRCEKAKGQARNAIYRAQLDDISACRGCFDAGRLPDSPAGGTLAYIDKIDKNMESKKLELQRLTSTLGKTEQRIQNVKNNLNILFRRFQKDNNNIDRFIDGDMSLEVIKSMCNFYEQRRNRSKNKIDLSMDLDISETSFADNTDNGHGKKLSDELKFYLNRFKLEKNRKLVLESGETLWLTECLPECSYKLTQQYNEETTRGQFFSPYLTISKNVENILNERSWYKTCSEIQKSLKDCDRKPFERRDIKTMTSEADNKIDKVKKRLDSNLTSLPKIVKHLEQCQENMKIFTSNQFKKYISEERKIGSYTFCEYESIYLKNLNPH